MTKLFLIIILVGFVNQNSFSQTMIKTFRTGTLYGFITNENEKIIELRKLNETKAVIPIENIKSKEEISVELKTNTGLVLKGKIKAARKSDFDFQTNDSINLTLSFVNIASVNSDDDVVKSYIDDKMDENKSESKYSFSKDSLDKDFKLTSFTKFGLAYGTPAEFNIFYGYNNQKTYFNLSAGLIGIQAGFGINAYTKSNVELNLLFNISYLNVSESGLNKGNKFYMGAGPIADLYLYGFHLQLGISKVMGISGALINFQIGYAYRFNN